MKLYLFGGAEMSEHQGPHVLKKMINKVLADLKPKQLLHVPYARIEVPEGEEEVWGEGWMSRDLNLEGIELLDTRNKGDLDKANNPLIFMNGGPQRDNLYEQITSNEKLHDLVINAEYLIGESAGSMVCAEYRISYRNNQGIITRGLAILRDTIIEAHYSERNRQQALREKMKEAGIHYGIGIDSTTAIVIDTETYPEKYSSIGNGSVDFVKSEKLE